METPFSLHLLELRFRAFYTLFSFFITFLLGTFYSTPLTHLICIPFSENADTATQGCFFIFTHVTEGLYAALEASSLCSVLFFIPLATYQIYSFLIPSFYRRERKVVCWILFFALILFLISICVAFFIVLPKMCAFLQQFQYQSKSIEIKLQARIAPAVRWSTTILLITISFFQIPVLFIILCILSRGGLPPHILSKNRKYAWFLLLLSASLLSPPDVYSQFALATIGCSLYEVLFWCALLYKSWLACDTG